MGDGTTTRNMGNDRKEKKGVRHYETIYIVNPTVSDDDYGDVVKKFRGILEKHKGIIIKVEEWGKQKLAYTIKKNDKGQVSKGDLSLEGHHGPVGRDPGL